MGRELKLYFATTYGLDHKVQLEHVWVVFIIMRFMGLFSQVYPPNSSLNQQNAQLTYRVANEMINAKDDLTISRTFEQSWGPHSLQAYGLQNIFQNNSGSVVVIIYTLQSKEL